MRNSILLLVLSLFLVDLASAFPGGAMPDLSETEKKCLSKELGGPPGGGAARPDFSKIQAAMAKCKGVASAPNQETLATTPPRAPKVEALNPSDVDVRSDAETEAGVCANCRVGPESVSPQVDKLKDTMRAIEPKVDPYAERSVRKKEAIKKEIVRSIRSMRCPNPGETGNFDPQAFVGKAISTQALSESNGRDVSKTLMADREIRKAIDDAMELKMKTCQRQMNQQIASQRMGGMPNMVSGLPSMMGGMPNMSGGVPNMMARLGVWNLMWPSAVGHESFYQAFYPHQSFHSHQSFRPYQSFHSHQSFHPYQVPIHSPYRIFSTPTYYAPTMNFGYRPVPFHGLGPIGR
jgi:hypothetical protein